MDIQLSAQEVRVIGALIEKEIATPEYYPMSLNALTNACNQKSSRDPVVSYSEDEVEEIVNGLRDKKLVIRVTGPDMRVPKFRQSFTEKFNLNQKQIAVMCTLMLRGAQTAGEIKTRSSRLVEFESIIDTEDTLNILSGESFGMVKKLPKIPGTKESRFVHLLSGDAEIPNPEEKSVRKDSDLTYRIESLENEVSNLKDELSIIKQYIDEIRSTNSDEGKTE